MAVAMSVRAFTSAVTVPPYLESPQAKTRWPSTTATRKPIATKTIRFTIITYEIKQLVLFTIFAFVHHHRQ
jgi:hypothetical protein